MRAPELPSNNPNDSEENPAGGNRHIMAAEIAVNYHFPSDWNEDAREPFAALIARFLEMGQELREREGYDLRATEALDFIGRDLRQTRKIRGRWKFGQDPFWEARLEFKDEYDVLLGDVPRKSFCDGWGFLKTGMTPEEIRKSRAKAKTEGGPTPTSEVVKPLRHW